MTCPAPLFAVHIADSVLLRPWEVGGLALMAVAVPLALWRLDDRDIPRIGVLTAAFFVASQVHFRIPGGVSVHLLLNGLIGVILGHRAPLAIAVGLTLQTLLFAHGGWWPIGVNFAVLSTPAVLAGLGYRAFAHRVSPFVGGLIAGLATASLTVLLNAAVLYYGSIDPTGFVAGVSLVAHLPVIAVEGIGVGFVCRVLSRAKPEWLGVGQPAGKISANGISH